MLRCCRRTLRRIVACMCNVHVHACACVCACACACADGLTAAGVQADARGFTATYLSVQITTSLGMFSCESCACDGANRHGGVRRRSTLDGGVGGPSSGMGDGMGEWCRLVPCKRRSHHGTVKHPGDTGASLNVCEAGESKVGNLDRPVLVQQAVGWLQISVDERRVERVQKEDAPRHLNSKSGAPRPR